MNALLINPWITDFKLYDEWMHPVGLYMLGSILKENNWEISYINCLERNTNLKSKRYNTGPFKFQIIPTPEIFNKIDRQYKLFGLSEDEFKTSLSNVETPDIIFITSGMTYWIEGLKKTIETVRKIYPSTHIVIGGISANLIPEKLKYYFPKTTIFSQQISSSSKINVLNNIVLNTSTKAISINPIFPYLKNMLHGPVLTTLGCPYSCSYCASKIIQPDFFQRPVDTIFNEIFEMHNSYNIKDFSFYDDALLINPLKNFIPLTEKILKQNFNFRFHAPNGLHIKWIDKNIASLMKLIGFKTLRFGYESGNKKHKDHTGYKTEQKEIANRVEILLSAGFPAKDIGIYVMGGLPDQTPKNMMEDIKFIHSLGVKAKPVFISPVPKTPLYNFYRQQFKILEEDPRSQNDMFFITQLKDWGIERVNEIKSEILKLNQKTEKN